MRLYDKQGSEWFRDLSRLFALTRAGDVNMVRDLLRQGLPVNRYRPYYPLSALLVACINGHLRLVQMLVEEFGADFEELQTEEGVSPLCWMAKEDGKQEAHRQVIHFLLDKGAAVDAVDAYGCSPLHRVIDAPTLDLLLARRPNVLLRDKYGNDPSTCWRTKNRDPAVTAKLAAVIASEERFQRRKTLLCARLRVSRLTLV